MTTYKEFTLVFDGDIRRFPNPHATETPFGIPVMSAVFNGLDKAQELEEERDALLRDCEHLLAIIDNLLEATGESLDSEDSAMVEQIRKSPGKS